MQIHSEKKIPEACLGARFTQPNHFKTRKLSVNLLDEPVQQDAAEEGLASGSYFRKEQAESPRSC